MNCVDICCVQQTVFVKDGFALRFTSCNMSRPLLTIGPVMWLVNHSVYMNAVVLLKPPLSHMSIYKFLHLSIVIQVI